MCSATHVDWGNVSYAKHTHTHTHTHTPETHKEKAQHRMEERDNAIEERRVGEGGLLRQREMVWGSLTTILRCV